MPETNGDGKMASLLIEYDTNSQGFRWKFEGHIPISSLVGALQIIQTQLANQQLAQIAAQIRHEQSTKIVLPDAPRPFFR